MNEQDLNLGDVKQEEKAPLSPKHFLPSGRKERVFAVLLLVLAFFAADATGFRSQLGYTLSFFLLGGAILGYLALSHRLRVKPYGLLCLLGGAALAASFARTADWELLFFAFFLVILAFFLCLLSWTGVAKRPFGDFSSLADVFNLAFVRTFGQMAPAMRGLFRREEKKRLSLGFLWGILLSIPVLIVLFGMLVSADAAFEGLVTGIKLPNFNWGLLFKGLLIFLMTFALSLSLRHSEPRHAPSARKEGLVSSAAVNGFLGAIGVLYILYLVSQIAYLANGFLGILPDGFTKAEYARRGFFEMVPLVLINLAIVLISARLVRREHGLPPLTRGLCTFLLAFSLFLVATALSKMVFYVQSYALSYNRLMPCFMMLWLVVCILAVGLRLFVPKMPYMKVAVVAALILANFACWGDVGAMVAKYNVHAYEMGIQSEIDVQYLDSLGDSAVPYLARLLDDGDSQAAQEAEEYLILKIRNISPTVFPEKETPDFMHWRLSSFSLEGLTTVILPIQDWREWNGARAEALSVYKAFLESRGITVVFQ